MKTNIIDNRQMEMPFGVLRREEGMYIYFYSKEQQKNPDKEDYPEKFNRLKKNVYKELVNISATILPRILPN